MTELMAAYFEELERTRETFDRRYDDIKRGRVRLIPGERIARGAA
jgi:hypothetical protein